MLLLKLGPDRQLVCEVSQKLVGLGQSCAETLLLINVLKLVSIDIDQETVGVRILRHGKNRQDGVH